jgi:hypothetical protein
MLRHDLCRLVQHFLVDDVVADRLAVEDAEDVLDGATPTRSTASRVTPATCGAAVSLFLAEFGPKRSGGVVEKQADLGREVPAFRMHDVNGCGRRFVFDENGL